MAFPQLLRHLFSHWRDNLIIWLGLLAIGALPAVLPAYAATIAGRSLAQRLDSASTSARNLLISGAGLDEALYDQVTDTLGPLLRRRVELRDLEIEGLAELYTPDGPRPFVEFLALHLHAFGELEEDVTLLEGRLPVPGEGNVIEAVVGPEVLTGPDFNTTADGPENVANLRVGDELRAPDGSRFRIVGVVMPADQESDTWWGTLLPFSFYRQARNGSNQPDTVVVSLLIPPEDMVGRFPGHAHQWRLLTDLGSLTVDNAAAAQSAVRDVETRLSTNFLQVDTGLVALIDTFYADLGRGRVTLFLLSVQALLLVFVAYALIAGALVERRRDEFISLSARGATVRRIQAQNGVEIGLLGLTAAAIAPLLGNAVLRLWAQGGEGAITVSPAAGTWLLAAAGVAAGLLIFLTITGLAARRSRQWAYPVARPPARPFRERYYLDFALLIAGGLLYRQTTAGGGQLDASRQSVAGAADPLLLLGPTLLLLAAALLVVRFYPYLLRGLARLIKSPSLPWRYGLSHLGRESGAAGGVALIVTLALGLAVFAALTENALAARQAEIAHFIAGADVRAGLAIDSSPENFAALAGLDGVAAASPAYRTRARWASELSRQATLLAVDPAGFAAAGRFPPDAGNLSIDAILPALAAPSAAGLPAVFSVDAFPQDKQVGDIVPYFVGSSRIDFEVRGLIPSFPSIDGPFLLTNLSMLEARLSTAQLGETLNSRREVWLEAEPGQAEAVAAAITRGEGPPGSVFLAGSAATRRELGADMSGRQAVAALRLNTWTVALVSFAAVAVLLVLAARCRASEFAVMRAIGVSPRQWLSLLLVEAAVPLAVGFVAGVAAGYGLARMMLPVLSRTLATAVGGGTIHRLAFDWPALLGLLGLFAAGYALALLALPAAMTGRPPSTDQRIRDE